MKKRLFECFSLANCVAFLAVLPLFVFTFMFVIGPLIYMFVLSFLQRAEVWGVVNKFTFKNYIDILEPIY